VFVVSLVVLFERETGAENQHEVCSLSHKILAEFIKILFAFSGIGS